VKTFNDESLELQAWIEKSLESGNINTSLIPNRAVWKPTKVEICDISGLRTDDSILNKLIEYAKSEDGEAFRQLLAATYK
jgi:hypothetical protein